MRIARILTRLNFGGPARQALASDPRLGAAGHEVRIFTGAPSAGEGDLFDAFVEAKKKCGEPADDLSFPRFHHLIATKADALKQRVGCDRVCFSIDIDGGHVSFKAKGDKD